MHYRFKSLQDNSMFRIIKKTATILSSEIV